MIENSIIIKEIAFQNFAQYQNFLIEFPDTVELGDNPILYFLGDNGSGKTRLFKGIRLALFGTYGINKEKIVNLLSQPIKDSIADNINNNKPNQSQKIFLAIVLKINDYGYEQYYRIQRTWIFDNFKIKRDLSLSADIIFDGDTPNVSIRETRLDDWDESSGDIEEKLQLWFPEEAREFYFFDGEKLENLVKGNNVKKKDLIRKILNRTDLLKLEKINEVLKEQKSLFSKESEKVERKSELTQKAFNRLKKAEEKIDNNKETVKTKQNEILKLEAFLTKLKEEKEELGLDNTTVTIKEKEKEIISKFDELNNERKILYAKIQSEFQANYFFEWMLIEEIIEEVRQDLDEKMRAGIIPTSFDKQIYEMVIDKKFCILCDRLIKDDDVLNRLKTKKNNAIDERLNREARRYIQVLDILKKQIQESKGKMSEEIKNFGINKKKIDDLGNIPKADKADYKKLSTFVLLTKKIADLEAKIPLFHIEIDELNELRPDLEKEVRKARNNYNRNLSGKEKILDSDLYLELATELQDNTEKLYNQLKHKIISFIISKTNANFKKLIPHPENYDGIYISDDWNFGFYPKGAIVPVQGEEGPSAGQFHIIGLSFLNGISKVAQFTLPILFDTPFGRISREPKANIAKNFPEMFEGTQIVFFLTDAEADKMLENIRDKKGFEIINPLRTNARYEEIQDDRLLERIEVHKSQQKEELET